MFILHTGGRHALVSALRRIAIALLTCTLLGILLPSAASAQGRDREEIPLTPVLDADEHCIGLDATLTDANIDIDPRGEVELQGRDEPAKEQTARDVERKDDEQSSPELKDPVRGEPKPGTIPLGPCPKPTLIEEIYGALPSPSPVDPLAVCQAAQLNGCTPTPAGVTVPTGQGPLVGTIGSDVSPSAQGAAQWSVAFDGPLGGPGIGLGFSSQANRGEAGHGFSLIGTSSIWRCARTELFDGVREGIDWSESPVTAKWCLDGVPLDNVSGGSGSWDYRTEPESYRVIRRDGNWSDTNVGFVVHERDGMIRRYRPVRLGTGASEVLAGFLIEEITDPFGNSRHFSWTTSGSVVNGTPVFERYRLNAVWWGANPAAGAPAHPYKLTLDWEPGAVATSFTNGMQIVDSMRLASATVGNGTNGTSPLDSTLLKRYELSYLDAPHESRDLLESVQLCETWDGSAWSDCLPPTEFEWTGHATSTATFPNFDEMTAFLSGTPLIGWEDPNEVGLWSPYEAARANSMRHFSLDGAGRTQRIAATTTVGLPNLEVSGKIEFSPNDSSPYEAHFVGDGNGNFAYDLHEFVFDRDYFYESLLIPCTLENVIIGPDYCGVELANNPLTTNCLISVADGTFNPFFDITPAQNRNEFCVMHEPDFIKNKFWKAVTSSYGAALHELLVAGANLRGDFNCDGRMDRLELDLINPANSVVLTGGGGTLPGPSLDTVYDTDFTWGSIVDRKFWKKMTSLMEALTDAYTGISVADFDGDGCSDIYQAWGTKTENDRIYLSTPGVGSGWQFMSGPETWLKQIDGLFDDSVRAAERVHDKQRIRFGHFNPDGCLDVYYINGYETGTSGVADNVWLGDCTGNWSHRNGPATLVRSSRDKTAAFGLTGIDLASIHLGNFNADGCTDVYTVGTPRSRNDNDSSDRGEVWLSHCDGTFESIPLSDPIWLDFIGEEKVDGRVLTSWSRGQDGTQNVSESSALPPEREVQWIHDLNQVNSVRPVDLNGDGMLDLYHFSRSSTARDTTYINLGDGSWQQGEGITSHLGDDVGAPRTWNHETQIAFDLARHNLVPFEGALLPGIHVGGRLRGDGIGPDLPIPYYWRIEPDTYTNSSLRLPEMTAVNDGRGRRTEIAYTTYRGTTDFRQTRRVVDSITTGVIATAGGGGAVEVDHRVNYSWSGLQIDTVHGDLGFATITSTQTEPTGDGRIRTRDEFWQQPGLAGTVKHHDEFVRIDGQWVQVASEASRFRIERLDTVAGLNNRDQHDLRLVPWPDCAGTTGYWGMKRTWDPRVSPNLASQSCSRQGPIDEWGNPSWTIVEHGDGRSVETNYRYQGGDPQFHERWGLATTVETRTTDWDGDTHCAVEWFAYDSATLVRNVMTVPLVTDTCNTTGTINFEHTRRNAYGLITETRVGGTNVTDRYTYHDYGPLELNASMSPDIWLERTWTVVDGATHETVFERPDTLDEWGTPLRTIDQNGSMVVTQRDSTGRVVLEARSGGESVQYFHGDEPSAAERDLLGAITRDWSVSNGGATSYKALDRQGRVVRAATITEAGLLVSDTWHDEHGRVSETSLPYLAATPESVDRSALHIVAEFDAVDRPLVQVSADGLQTTHTYDLGYGNPGGPYYGAYAIYGRQNITTVAGASSSTYSDAAGRTIGTTNALGESIWFEHDPNGNVTAITDAGGNETRATFDNWGRATGVAEPNMGSSTLVWDALDQLDETTDAMGNRRSFTYDTLGRKRTETLFAPDGTLWDTYGWEWDTASVTGTSDPAVGLLHRQTSAHETTTLSYDAYVRPRLTVTSLSVDGSTESLSTFVSYDNRGRVDEVSNGGRLKVTNVYGTSGALVEKQSDAGPLWRAVGWDDRGALALTVNGAGSVTHVARESATGRVASIAAVGAYGALQDVDLEWNLRGNLEDLTNNVTGLAETFGYDDLDRIRTSTIVGGATAEYDFDQLGNLTRKSDHTSAPYEYNQTNGAGPNAVTAIGTTTYAYDANGNLVTETDGLSLVGSYTWNPANLVDTVDRSGGTSRSLDVTYGVDAAKVHQTTTVGAATDETWYLGAGHRLLIGDDGSRTYEIDVATPSGTVGVFVRKSPVDESFVWSHVDHLGSPQVFTDETGAPVQVQSFTPYGAPRHPITGDGYGIGAGDTPLFEDGYTGHDRVDDLGLVNMVARIYDPRVGRFVQPDSWTPDASDNQAYARYTYVRGNPHRITDPSGHNWNYGGGYGGVVGGSSGFAAFYNVGPFGGGNPCGSICSPTAPMGGTTLGHSATGGLPSWISSEVHHLQPIDPFEVGYLGRALYAVAGVGELAVIVGGEIISLGWGTPVALLVAADMSANFTIAVTGVNVKKKALHGGALLLGFSEESSMKIAVGGEMVLDLVTMFASAPRAMSSLFGRLPAGASPPAGSVIRGADSTPGFIAGKQVVGADEWNAINGAIEDGLRATGQIGDDGCVANACHHMTRGSVAEQRLADYFGQSGLMRQPDTWTVAAEHTLKKLGYDATAYTNALTAQMALNQARPGTRFAVHLRDGDFAHAVRAVAVAGDGQLGSRWNTPHFWIVDSGIGSHGGAYRMTIQEMWDFAEGAVQF